MKFKARWILVLPTMITSNHLTLELIWKLVILFENIREQLVYAVSITNIGNDDDFVVGNSAIAIIVVYYFEIY